MIIMRRVVFIPVESGVDTIEISWFSRTKLVEHRIWLSKTNGTIHTHTGKQTNETNFSL